MKPMNWTDQDLMAHADGEGDATRRAALDAALRDDAALRARWLALATQRQRVSAAFAGVLEEPVPDRLTALLAAPALPAASAPVVVDLAAARAQRDARRGLSWAQWGGLAASLALAVVLGMQLAPGSAGGGSLLAEADGRVVAAGPLARALATQLAADAPADGGVRVQISFVDQGGRYCRTFTAQRVAGLACNEGAHWAVQATADTGPPAPDAGLRQAATPLPKAVLDAVDARIAGNALSAEQERSARERGWKSVER